MDINVTLLGQMLTFGVLILVVYRRILPVLRAAIEERQREINEGIAAGRLGQQNLRNAAELIENRVAAAHKQANVIVKQAEFAADGLIAEARVKAERLRDEYLLAAKKELDIQAQQIRKELLIGDNRRVVSILQRVLSDDSDCLAAVNQQLLEDAARQI